MADADADAIKDTIALLQIYTTLLRSSYLKFEQSIKSYIGAYLPIITTARHILWNVKITKFATTSDFYHAEKWPTDGHCRRSFLSNIIDTPTIVEVLLPVVKT